MAGEIGDPVIVTVVFASLSVSLEFLCRYWNSQAEERLV